MLHELLFTLYGNSQFIPDDIMLYKPNIDWDAEAKTVVKKFCDYYHFLHPSEKEVVKNILEIALHYKKLEIFSTINEYSSSRDTIKEKSVIHRQYHSAFASGVSEEMIFYKNELVLLEEQILQDPQTPLSSIFLKIQPFYFIFSQLGYLIDVIQKESLQGGKLLEILHRHVISSVGNYHESLRRIEKQVLKVFFDQISYWLMYGELLDRENEFFIATVNSQDNAHFPENIGNEFCINLNMLPDFVEENVAHKVLFIGESKRFYAKAPNTNDGCKVSLQIEEEEFLRRLKEISEADNFSPTEFADLVGDICRSVSEQVYTLITEAGLISELQRIKEIYLLGRGELYQAFFTLADSYFKQLPIYVSKMKYNALFQKAGRQVLLNDSFMEKFTLTYEGKSELDNAFAWKHFYIKFKIEWPLHKIFSQQVMEKYNTILQFLLDVQRTQYSLQNLWVVQKASKHTNKPNEEIAFVCLMLRHHMTHFICNFQYYIQVDVLESQYCILLEKISCTKDYQNLCMAHLSFLTAVISHCFLCHPIFSSTISSILKKIQNFCSALECSSDENFVSKVSKMKEEYDMEAAKFFWSLTVLGHQRSSQYTTQLITRLDYNNFYSSKSAARRFLR